MAEIPQEIQKLAGMIFADVEEASGAPPAATMEKINAASMIIARAALRREP